MRRILFISIIMFGAVLRADTVLLSTLDLAKATQEWGKPEIIRTDKGQSLAISSVPFTSGFSADAPSVIYIDLKGAANRFTASVGVTDQPKQGGKIEFRVYGDDKLLWKSETMQQGDKPVRVDLPVTGVKTLILETKDRTDAGHGSHGAWVDGQLDFTATPPETIDGPPPAGILTPTPGPQARIHGPKIFGARPGSPFLYTIPVTGQRPISFVVKGLPAGLTLDAQTGQITGSIATAGTYSVTLHASNELGDDDKPFRIVIGDAIALTPPMGWNSWNCWGESVSAERVATSARELVNKGLSDHGWSYINIDDGWQGIRGTQLNSIQPNTKFPDMAALGILIHSFGLKFGIYSTPWRGSYAGHIGGSCDRPDGIYDWVQSGNCTKDFLIKSGGRSNWTYGKYSFADKDATQFGRWGVDYLKYDWYPINVKSTTAMSDALKATGRDIVLSLSNAASIKQVSDWAREANLWRTTKDISDSWSSMSHIGFKQSQWAAASGPGHWNDPDMLIVGNVGWGNPHPTSLTHDEQYTHISLWCLLSAPLLLGCNLQQLDDFTLNLLTNDEVLAVDQDALGQEATPVASGDDWTIYAKKLEDGTWAVGMFNLDLIPQKISLSWSALKLQGAEQVRDLWRQKNIGAFSDSFSTEVAPHGVMLVRISPSR